LLLVKFRWSVAKLFNHLNQRVIYCRFVNQYFSFRFAASYMASIDIQAIAKQTIMLEAASVAQLVNYIDAQFEKIVQLIAACKGKVVISGIGKSAVIAQKIVATFNSTGTSASFLHA